jgi:hypothetical protein
MKVEKRWMVNVKDTLCERPCVDAYAELDTLVINAFGKIVLTSFLQQSFTSSTTRPTCVCTDKRFVRGPRRKRPTTSCPCRRRLLKGSTQMNGIRNKNISLMEYRITTEWTISREPATRTARHRSLRILPSVCFETKKAYYSF